MPGAIRANARIQRGCAWTLDQPAHVRIAMPSWFPVYLACKIVLVQRAQTPVVFAVNLSHACMDPANWATVTHTASVRRGIPHVARFTNNVAPDSPFYPPAGPGDAGSDGVFAACLTALNVVMRLELGRSP
jgi:hypothetical protein